MNFFERVPANVPDKIFGERGRNLVAPLVPFSESEREANADIQLLEHTVTSPRASTSPGDEAASPSSKPSKKNNLFDGKGIVIATILGLATGAALGGVWSSPHIFTENLKATNLRGVVETIFAGSSKAEQSAQPLPVAAGATDPKLSAITDQLVAIATDLSSVQQNIKELASGQEQIRNLQVQLALTQSRFAVLQAQANIQQKTQPSPQMPEGRKLNRRDVYTWR